MPNEEHTSQPAGLSVKEQIQSRLMKQAAFQEEDAAPAQQETTDQPIEDGASDDLHARDEESLDEPGVVDAPEDDDSESDEPTVLTREEAELIMVETDDGPKPMSEIMRGDMREAHYTQNRQIQADTKRAFDAVLSDGIFQAAANATFLDEQLKAYEHVNWEQLSRTQPEVYDREKPAFEALSGYRDQVVQRFKTMKEQAEKLDKEQLERDWQEVETNLKFTVPGWSKELKAKRDQEGKRRGFSDDELAKMADTRFQKMLIELAQFRAISEGKAKPKGKPRAVKASSQGNDKIAALRRAANKGDRDARKQLQRAGIESKLKRIMGKR